MAKKPKPKELSRYEQIEWVNCEGCKFAGGAVENAHNWCDITKTLIPTTCYIYKSAYSDTFIRVTKRNSHLKNVIRWEVSDIEADKYEEATLEFQKEINYE